MTALVLGPLLRHVGERTATVWVETDRPCEVRVVSQEHGVNAAARTFTVHGHHYALVDVDGLEPGASVPYEVTLDGETVWPEPQSAFPASTLRTLAPEPGGTLRIAFGSCRRSPDKANRHGLDALAAYGHALAGGGERPDVLLMVGDQVYADELSDEMRAFIARRRKAGQEPYDELADYEDYTYLYRLAWHDDPAVRWLLSTVPTYTVFDDHDIRDDWNTSYAWRQQMAATPWWHERIVGGLGSYWIYQHLGNLSPEERAADPVYEAVRAASERDGDGAKVLDEFADRADREPASMRWSYAHDWGGTRLIVVDSRCSRLLTTERRSMLDDQEFRWLDEQCQGDRDHLLIASSLPYLLPRTIHNAENWNEAMADGAWGKRGAWFAEKMRQAADLEHWGAFNASFRAVAEDVLAVARGERGAAPASISFLSGDIHYSYLARVTSPDTTSVISQIVCSPFRNQLAGTFRWANKIAITPGTAPAFRLLARMAKVAPPPLRWRITDGPWFDNAIATVTLSGRESRVRWRAPRTETELSELHDVQITGG